MHRHTMHLKALWLLLVQPSRKSHYSLHPNVYADSYSFSIRSWLRDNLDVIKDVKELAEVTETVEDCGGVYFVPAFSGLYAPYWKQEARG